MSMQARSTGGQRANDSEAGAPRLTRRTAVAKAVDRDALRNGSGMDESELKARLSALSQEHRDLDAAIDALARSSTADMLQIARLKKRKLRLKDEMAVIQDMLIPDIIA